MPQRTETGKILFGHVCQKIQQKGFTRAAAKSLEALDRWVHFHKKEQASRKPGKLQTSMANVVLIFLSFPMLKSVDLTDPTQSHRGGLQPCRLQQTLTLEKLRLLMVVNCCNSPGKTFLLNLLAKISKQDLASLRSLHHRGLTTEQIHRLTQEQIRKSRLFPTTTIRNWLQDMDDLTNLAEHLEQARRIPSPARSVQIESRLATS
jgi:hypothetical protein